MIQKSVDNIILAAAFALMCLSSYYLYFRPFPRNNKLGLPPVAKLSFAENTVKYRGYDNFSWENAKGGLPLVLGDSLYTHESSGARITFDSGPILSMDPFTLLKITQSQDEFALDLLSGNISAQLNGEGDHITLLLGKRKFRLSGKKAKIKIRKNGNSAQISVLKGQVEISEGEDQNQEFGISEVQLSEERGIPKEAFIFDIALDNLPSELNKIFPNESINFSFIPSKMKDKGPFSIHLENTSTGATKTFETFESSVQLRRLKPGFYSTKITQKIGDKEIKSPLFNFNLEYHETPYFSLTSQEVTIGEKEGPTALLFSIDEQIYPQILQLVKDETILKEIEIPEVSVANDIVRLPFSHSFQKPGLYNFRLKPKNYDQKEFMRSLDFRVNFKESPKIEISQTPNEIFYEPIPSSGTKIILEKPNQLVTFQWQGKLDSKEFYEFQVSQTSDFKETLVSKNTQEKTTKIGLGAKGEYYWRVRIKDKTGKIRFGEPVKIEIQPAPPPKPLKLKEKIELKIKKRKTSSLFKGGKSLVLSLLRSFLNPVYAEESYTTLTWPSDNLAKAYLLRIFKESDPEKPFIEIEVEKPEFIWNNPEPGTYFWDVAIKDFWERIGDYSNRSTVVLKGEPLPIDLVAPKHNFKVSAKRKSNIRFKFNNLIKGKILFSKSLDFKMPLLSLPIKGNSVSLNPNVLRELKQDSLYWRITDAKRKSLRRKLIFLKPKRIPKKIQTPILTQNILPEWENRIFQKVSSVSADQSGSAFDAKASGLFVNLIGFQKLLSFEKKKAWQMEVEVGKGVAFDTLDYFQGRLNIFRHSKSVSELRKSWNTFYGIETQYQTSFEESSANNLTAVNNALFGGLLGLRSPFTLFAPQEVSLEFVYGNFLTYRASLRSHWGLFKKFPFSTLLFLENLKYEDGLNELSRTSLGLAWEFSF